MSAYMRLIPKSLILLAGLSTGLWSQTPETPAAATDPNNDTPIRVSVREIVAPTTVVDKDGNFIDNIKGSEFKLLDNGKDQTINVNVTQTPISVVVIVQANYLMEGILPRLQKMGPLLSNLITGERGEAAIIAFDHRIQLLQDFTTDSALLTKGLERLKPGSSSSRMKDAVLDGIQRLRRRDPNNRKVIILVSETRDNSSEAGMREVLQSAQIYNVMVYAVPVNRMVTNLTAKTPVPRPDPIPPGGRYIPGGAPQTPLSAQQMTGTGGGGINFVPLFEEIFKQAKAVFVDNPVEVMTKYTGGSEFPFVSQRGLEDAFAKLGNELHSQYLLTYSPNTLSEPGYHTIQVVVARKGLEVRTRPGYYSGTAR